MERLVQCLSPVHVGTGKELEPFDYIVDGQRYIRVHLDAVLERMTPEQADTLAAWVSKRADQIVDLEGKKGEADKRQVNERISSIRREMHLLNVPGVDAALKEALRKDTALARYHGERGFERNLQVREQAKDADETPLLPGSSIKGSLRTALAFVALEEMAKDERKELGRAFNAIVKEAENAKRQRSNGQVRRLQESIGREIEQVVFRCGKQRRGGPDYTDIHYDLMRAVSISDTCDAQAELIVPQIYTFVEQRSRDGHRGLDAQAPLIVEAHAPGNTFGLRLRIDGNLLRAASRNRRGDEWIHFEQRVRRAFGPEVARLLPDAPDAQLDRAVLTRMETAARRFAKAVVAAERRWEESHGHGSTDALRDFYEKLDSLMEKGLVPLRLGWGSHFMGTTLLLVLKEDEGWRSILEGCFRVFDIGIPPGLRRGMERKIDLDDFPRSRRLVADGGKRPVAPLGWVALAPTAGELPGPLVEKDRLIVGSRWDGYGQGRKGEASGDRRGESGVEGQSRAGAASRDPAVEAAKQVEISIRNLRGRGEVSRMPEIVGQIARLQDSAARFRCAELLKQWLMQGGKKSLWRNAKYADEEWRRQLDALLEQRKQ